MASITFGGLAEYEKELQTILRDVPKLVNASLYDGAAVLADAVQNEIAGLTELTPEARQGLHNGLGIARFWSEKGSTVTKIGFTGYNQKKTKRWPSGQPNAMIARSLIRGTSWMRANRFTNRAAKKARERCIGAMQTRFDIELQKITNNY